MMHYNVFNVNDRVLMTREWMLQLCEDKGYDYRLSFFLSYAVNMWVNKSKAAIQSKKIYDTISIELVLTDEFMRSILIGVPCSESSLTRIRKTIEEGSFFHCQRSDNKTLLVSFDMENLRTYVKKSRWGSYEQDVTIMTGDAAEEINFLRSEVARLKNTPGHSELEKPKAIPTESIITPIERTRFDLDIALRNGKADKALRGVLESSGISREEFLDSFAYWLTHQWKGNEPFVVRADGSGLPKLFAIHADFVTGNKGQGSKQYRDMDEYPSIAKKFVDHCRHDDKVSQAKFDPWGSTYLTYGSIKKNRPDEWYDAEIESITDALKRGLITKVELRKMAAMAYTVGDWSLNIKGSAEFQQYNFEDPSSRADFLKWIEWATIDRPKIKNIDLSKYE